MTSDWVSGTLKCWNFVDEIQQGEGMKVKPQMESVGHDQRESTWIPS